MVTAKKIAPTKQATLSVKKAVLAVSASIKKAVAKKVSVQATVKAIGKNQPATKKKTSSVKTVKSSIQKFSPLEVDTQPKIKNPSKLVTTNIPVLRKELKKTNTGLKRKADPIARPETLGVSNSKTEGSFSELKENPVSVKKASKNLTETKKVTSNSPSVTSSSDIVSPVSSFPSASPSAQKSKVIAKTTISKGGVWPFPVGTKP